MLYVVYCMLCVCCCVLLYCALLPLIVRRSFVGRASEPGPNKGGKGGEDRGSGGFAKLSAPSDIGHRIIRLGSTSFLSRL